MTAGAGAAVDTGKGGGAAGCTLFIKAPMLGTEVSDEEFVISRGLVTAGGA